MPRSALSTTLWQIVGGLTPLALAAAVFALQPGGGFRAVAAAPAVAPASARLLTQDQFANSIGAIFGTDVVPSLRFPPLKRVEGLTTLGTASAVVTPGAFEQFDAAARKIAAKVVDEQHRGYLIGCSAEEERAAAAQCVRRFFERSGRLLFRRPLAGQELDLYARIAEQGARQGRGIYDGIELALSGMLISPKVLLVSEATERDPVSGAPRLGGYAKAARLSLLLWNAVPDAALLDAAAAGDLHDPVKLARQVDRMLASPRAEAGIRAFFRDWMMYDGFETLTKDSLLYPAYTRRVAAEAEEQALRTIVYHIRQGRDYRDLFTTRDIFVNRELGPVQRLSLTQPVGWSLYRMPDDGHRAGILTLPAFLSLHSHPGRSSATLRGKALREIFMCQPVPPPPPNVNFSIVEDPTHARSTGRERVAAHLENAVCAGCHKITDPMGLALENFDGAGQFRETENGQRIDASGELGGTKFTNAGGLGVALRNDPATAECLVTRLYSYSQARPVGDADQDQVQALSQSFARGRYRFDGLLRAVVLEPTFFGGQPAVPAQKMARLGR